MKADDPTTLSALGVLAAMIAALAHEALGHGGACLATGGEITLLTVIWFRCSPGAAIVDLAGPVGGFLAGAGGLALAAYAARSAVRARLFGLVLGAFALFWFFGQLVSDGLLARDDWNAAATEWGWPWFWRFMAVCGGVLGYAVTVRLVWTIARGLNLRPRPWRTLVIPYVAGALALIACAAIRPDDGSASEIARAVGVAPLGYLYAVTRPSLAGDGANRVARSWAWITTAAVSLAAYAAVFGPGLGRLA